ncbi:hypothetical protein TNCT_340961, partial [Trichonephila clavata]
NHRETTIDPPLLIRECCPAFRFKSSDTGDWISRKPYFTRGSPMSRTYPMPAEEKQESFDTMDPWTQ